MKHFAYTNCSVQAINSWMTQMSLRAYTHQCICVSLYSSWLSNGCISKRYCYEHRARCWSFKKFFYKRLSVALQVWGITVIKENIVNYWHGTTTLFSPHSNLFYSSKNTRNTTTYWYSLHTWKKKWDVTQLVEHQTVMLLTGVQSPGVASDLSPRVNFSADILTKDPIYHRIFALMVSVPWKRKKSV